MKKLFAAVLIGLLIACNAQSPPKQRHKNNGAPQRLWYSALISEHEKQRLAKERPGAISRGKEGQVLNEFIGPRSLTA